MGTGTLRGGEATELVMSGRYVGSARLIPHVNVFATTGNSRIDTAGIVDVICSCSLWHAKLSDQANAVAELRFYQVLGQGYQYFTTGYQKINRRAICDLTLR